MGEETVEMEVQVLEQNQSEKMEVQGGNRNRRDGNVDVGSETVKMEMDSIKHADCGLGIKHGLGI